VVDPQVSADGPAQFLQLLEERSVASLEFRIVRRSGQKHADTPHAFALLRACRERSRRRCAKRG
jgi:hypothetical protein